MTDVEYNRSERDYKTKILISLNCTEVSFRSIDYWYGLLLDNEIYNRSQRDSNLEFRSRETAFKWVLDQ